VLEERRQELLREDRPEHIHLLVDVVAFLVPDDNDGDRDVGWLVWGGSLAQQRANERMIEIDDRPSIIEIIHSSVARSRTHHHRRPHRPLRPHCVFDWSSCVQCVGHPTSRAHAPAEQNSNVAYRSIDRYQPRIESLLLNSSLDISISRTHEQAHTYMSKAQLAARVTPPNAALLRLPSGASSLASLSGLAGDTILGVCNRCHKDLMLADLASPWPDLERSEWALKSYELLLPSTTATSPTTTTTTTTTTEAPASLCSTTMDDATGRDSPRHDEHRAEPEELLILQTPDNALLSSHELDSPLVHSQDSDDGEFVVVRRKSNWERAQFHTRIRFLVREP